MAHLGLSSYGIFVVILRCCVRVGCCGMYNCVVRRISLHLLYTLSLSLSLSLSPQLFIRCDATGARNTRSVADKKRSAPSFPDAPQESVEILDRERRVVSTRAAPTPPFAAMNYSSHCVSNAVSIFTSLPERLCGEERIDRSNSACWTGVSFGR